MERTARRKTQDARHKDAICNMQDAKQWAVTELPLFPSTVGDKKKEKEKETTQKICAKGDMAYLLDTPRN